MENRMMERSGSKIVITKVFAGNTKRGKMFYFEPGISIKQIYLFALLILGSGGLLLTFFGEFLFEAAFTIAMHHRFIPVLAKIFSNEIFIGIILRHYYNLVKGL